MDTNESEFSCKTQNELTRGAYSATENANELAQVTCSTIPQLLRWTEVPSYELFVTRTDIFISTKYLKSGSMKCRARAGTLVCFDPKSFSPRDLFTYLSCREHRTQMKFSGLVYKRLKSEFKTKYFNEIKLWTCFWTFISLEVFSTHKNMT